MSATSTGVPDVNSELAEFIVELSYDTIPSEIVRTEKFHILDTLGCMIYGSTTPWVTRFVSALEATEDGGSSTVVGQDTGVTPRSAVMLNGASAHSMDYDDYCLDGGIHAGSATVPPALALAERDESIGGKDTVTAVTAGVETGIRVGIGIGRQGGIAKGFHIGGWTGAAAAAATTGKLLGLTVDQQRHAIAMSLSLGAGLLGAARGANIKRFHMGRAAESGYLAAHLALHSAQGDTEIWERTWGSLYALAGEGFNPEGVVERLGDEYAITDKLCIKPFPSIGTIHPSVTTVSELIKEHDIESEDVAHIRVFVTKNVEEKVGRDYEPIDVMSAQGSLKYALAAYLEDNELSIHDYTEEAIQRKDVINRTHNIDVVVDESLGTLGAYDFMDDTPYKRSRRVRLALTTTDGETYERIGDIPNGWPNNPLSEAKIRKKFRNLTRPVFDRDQVSTLQDSILGLENVESMTSLLSTLSE